MNIKTMLNNKKIKTVATVALLALPSLALANDGSDARNKVNTIGKVILNILIGVVGIFLTIMLMTRAMKIMQGEMSARELIPPIAGGVVAFLSYYLAKVVLDNMFKATDVNF